MFTIVKNATFAAGISLMALSGAAYAAGPVAVSGVDVETQLGAIESDAALALYPTMNEDLEVAIAQRVTGGDGVDDPVVKVRINKLALDGAALIPGSEKFNEMEGVVSLQGESDEMSGISFVVKVAAIEGSRQAPEGYIMVPPSDADFYQAMMNTFADNVAEKLAENNVGVPAQ